MEQKRRTHQKTAGKILDTSSKPLESLGLTPRESEVLLWVSHGKASREIAAILESTLGTVNKHLEHIYRKLNVETRTSAAAIAFEILLA